MITKEELKSLGFVRINSPLNLETNQHYFPAPVPKGIRIAFLASREPQRWLAIDCRDNNVFPITYLDSIEDIKAFIKNY